MLWATWVVCFLCCCVHVVGYLGSYRDEANEKVRGYKRYPAPHHYMTDGLKLGATKSKRIFILWIMFSMRTE